MRSAPPTAVQEPCLGDEVDGKVPGEVYLTAPSERHLHL